MLYKRRVPIATAIAGLRDVFLAASEVQIIYLIFDRFPKIEEIFGWEKLDSIIAHIDTIIADTLRESYLNRAQMVSMLENDEVLILLVSPPPQMAALSSEMFNELLRELRAKIVESVDAVFGSGISSLVELHAGSTIVQFDSRIRLDRQIYRGIRAAQTNANSVEGLERVREVEDLRETLRIGGVSTEYQPIVSAETGKVFGYEALARGTIRSMLYPEVMFEVAAQTDLVWELSRLCRSKALEGAEAILKEDELLFLNVDPYDFFDPSFLPETLDSVLKPDRTVIEITERTAIKNYPIFQEQLHEFRIKGFRFAVDDAGSGYAGLGSIANLEPDFIKLDLSLISEIDSNFIKQELVSGIVKFANDQSAKVIAEGIERREELETVKRLGVHYVQGYYFQHLDQRSD